MDHYPSGTWALLLVALLSATAGAAEPTPVDEVQIRAAVQRAVSPIVRDGDAWIENRKCATCHQVPSMIWSLHAAQARGLVVDAEHLTAKTQWAIDDCLAIGEKSNNVDVLVHVSLALEKYRIDEKTRDHLKNLAVLIAKAQQEDGSWKPGGQLPGQKRPLPETTQVTTAWGALALSSQTDDELVKSRDRAVAWLGNHAEPGISTEWWAARLLLARRLGNADEADKLLAGLKGRQNADGGWNWKNDDPSDALGTGLAVYTLCSTGLTRDDPAVARGVEFLVRTQGDDGVWQVHSTLERKKTEIIPTSISWGAAWALIGLTSALPPAAAVQLPPASSR